MRLDAVEPGPLFIFVDHPNAFGGAVRLSISVNRLAPGCADGLDNDQDGFIDLADPGCTHDVDPDETDPDVPNECADTLDNDMDGLIDFPTDPGCIAHGDASEVDADELPACANGLMTMEMGLLTFPMTAVAQVEVICQNASPLALLNVQTASMMIKSPDRLPGGSRV